MLIYAIYILYLIASFFLYIFMVDLLDNIFDELLVAFGVIFIWLIAPYAFFHFLYIWVKEKYWNAG